MGKESSYFYRSPVGILHMRARDGYLTGLAVVREVSQEELDSSKERVMTADGEPGGMECVGGAPAGEPGGMECAGGAPAGEPEGMEPAGKSLAAPEQSEESVLREAVRQLDEYFAGKRRKFSIPLKTHGTDFQERVWEALRRIPYGETRTYGQIAAQVGNPGACRAVGGANHNNPILILTPCHRVIGADGSLTGFGGGLDVKEALLALETLNKD